MRKSMRFKKEDKAKSEESLDEKNSEARSSFKGMFGKGSKSEENEKKEEDDGGKKRGGLFGKSMRKSSKVQEPDLGSERGSTVRKSLFGGKKKDKDKDDEPTLADEKGSKVRKSLFGKKKDKEKEKEKETAEQKEGTAWNRSLGASDSGLDVADAEGSPKKGSLRSPFGSRRKTSDASASGKEQKEKEEKEKKEQEEKEKEFEKQQELERQREVERQKELERQQELERQTQLEKEKQMKEEKEKQLAMERAGEEKRQREEAEKRKKEAEKAAYGTTQVKLKKTRRGIMEDKDMVDRFSTSVKPVQSVKDPRHFSMLQRKVELLGAERDMLDTYSRALNQENERLRKTLISISGGKSF